MAGDSPPLRSALRHGPLARGAAESGGGDLQGAWSRGSTGGYGAAGARSEDAKLLSLSRSTWTSAAGIKPPDGSCGMLPRRAGMPMFGTRKAIFATQTRGVLLETFAASI